MNTDTEIKVKGFKALSSALGPVEAERFISLILKEPFDYTRWQRDLFAERSIEEISSAAMAFREKSQSEPAAGNG